MRSPSLYNTTSLDIPADSPPTSHELWSMAEDYQDLYGTLKPSHVKRIKASALPRMQCWVSSYLPPASRGPSGCGPGAISLRSSAASQLVAGFRIFGHICKDLLSRPSGLSQCPARHTPFNSFQWHFRVSPPSRKGPKNFQPPTTLELNSRHC